LHFEEKYHNSIKIAYYTENNIPDFNVADYAIGQTHINYLDRYLRIPYLFGLSYNYTNSKLFILRKIVLKNQKRKKFCAAVISNHRSYSNFRLHFINELNKYKKVDMGGSYNNNVGKIIDKVKFLTDYKFSIAMENSEGDGYMSEKIIQSFIAGTIPIYYGDYMVDEFINPKSYILIRGEKDMKQKIEYIKKINEDENLYKKILRENLILDINIKKKIEEQKQKFLMTKKYKHLSYKKIIPIFYLTI
jgi:hypothetical protein